jgi:hypothetical protein
MFACFARWCCTSSSSPRIGVVSNDLCHSAQRCANSTLLYLLAFYFFWRVYFLLHRLFPLPCRFPYRVVCFCRVVFSTVSFFLPCRFFYRVIFFYRIVFSTTSFFSTAPHHFSTASFSTVSFFYRVVLSFFLCLVVFSTTLPFSTALSFLLRYFSYRVISDPKLFRTRVVFPCPFKSSCRSPVLPSYVQSSRLDPPKF